MARGKSEEKGKGEGGGRMGVNPIQLQKHLKGVHYPASKNELVEKATSSGAHEKIMDALNRLPDREFGRPTDVTQQIAKER